MRSLQDLTNCHEDSQGISHCQVGNGSRSLQDLIDCQEGSRKIPICQVGRDEQMRLSEGLIKSEVSLNQPEELIEEEDQRSLLMIGGIQVFLPLAQEEAKIYVVDAKTTEARQPAETIRE